MSRVDSQYERKPRDSYETPAWVTEALLPNLPSALRIWEPACGGGNVVKVLAGCGYDVLATDKVNGEDFFDLAPGLVDGIVTNPPYAQADLFISRAIRLMEPGKGFVAMLLPSDFDSAKSRRPMFADCPQFARTVVLTRRIVWFERPDGKKAAPSENHRWYIWDWKHSGPPTIAYAP